MPAAADPCRANMSLPIEKRREQGTAATRARTVWLVSIVSSALLLGLVLAQVDWTVAQSIAGTIDYVWIGAGIGLLLMEGVVTAARFALMARPAARFRQCLVTTAWYVLLLIGLPARLGEVAGIALIVRYMQQRAGTAAASLIFQRVFDMVVLVSLLGVFSIAALGARDLTAILLPVAAVVAALIAAVIYLEQLLAWCARPFLARRDEKWPRRIARVLLQARGVRRHHMDRRRTLVLAALTVAKWLANLTGIGCVVLAVVPALPAVSAFGLGIVYNLAAVIPIQTIGGFGISEAVLLGGFKWLGYSLSAGAPLAIAIRIALISAPLLFWILIVATRPAAAGSIRRT